MESENGFTEVSHKKKASKCKYRKGRRQVKSRPVSLCTGNYFNLSSNARVFKSDIMTAVGEVEAMTASGLCIRTVCNTKEQVINLFEMSTCFGKAVTVYLPY